GEKAYRIALAHYERARAAPNALLCRYNLSVVLRLTGRRRDSEAEYRAAFRGVRDHAGAHFALGNFLGDARPTEAIAEYRAALKIQEDFPEAHVNLGNLLTDRDEPDEALAEFEAAIATKRPFPEAYKANNGRGGILQRKGRKAAAIKAYRAAIKINNDFADAHYNLANVLYADRLDDAIAEYRKAIRC